MESSDYLVPAEEERIVSVAATVRAAMQLFLHSADREKRAAGLARSLRHRHNRAKFATLFMSLSQNGPDPLKPRDINRMLVPWMKDDEYVGHDDLGYLPYPEDRTKVAQALVFMGVLEHSRKRQNRKWGRPKAGSEMNKEEGGRPSYYPKTERMRELEELFAKPQARQMLGLLLNYDLTLYHFTKSTLSILLVLLLEHPETAEAIARVTAGPSSSGIKIPKVEFDKAYIDSVASWWAASLVPRFVNEPFFLFGLLQQD